jgi:hypothetical protein
MKNQKYMYTWIMDISKFRKKTVNSLYLDIGIIAPKLTNI